MGIYSDWAPKYFESGLYTVPCGVNKDKAPPFLNWTDFCDIAPSEKQIIDWTLKYKDANQIGLLLGKSTQKVAFDFDYAYNPKSCKISEEDFIKDRQRIEKEIMELLPDSSAGKVGAKGWTRFYKWNHSLINRSINRNGVRLFDFLSTGKQTIIPPSIHSTKTDGGKIIYQWIDSPLEEFDELPELSSAIIDTIAEMYSDQRAGQRIQLKDQSRHERVMYFIHDILKVDDDLDRVVNATIQYDIKVNSGLFNKNDKPYLSDSARNKSNDTIKNTKLFVEKMNKWMIKKNALADKNERKENKKLNENSWDHFFEIAFFEARKDIFNETTYVRKNITSKWEPILQYEGVLRSYAVGKKIPKTHVVDELQRWIYEKSDLKFLCDIPEWDGVDRIDKIAGSIISDRFTRPQIIEIFKYWGVHIFRRIFDSSIQNRCIILKGNQGFGKDTVVRSLLKDFKPYYESTTLPGTPKDVLEIVSRLLVVHIEEFEQTKGLDIGFLKSLITQPTSFFRESYGHSPNSKIMRPSFISTANVDDIFRDPTGNRRFIVIPVEEIKWDYPQDQSLQVVAQWRALFNKNEYFKLTDETDAIVKIIIDEYTPPNFDESIIELYKSRAHSLTSSLGLLCGKTVFDSRDVMECLCGISKTLSCSLRRVQSALKNGGFSVKTREGARYFTMPSHAAEYKIKHSDA